jgi:hypothetical protein
MADDTGGKTTRFQPHRADGKRNAASRRTAPSVFWPVLGLAFLIGKIVIEPGEAFELEGWRATSVWLLQVTLACYMLLGWVRDLVAWHKEK